MLFQKRLSLFLKIFFLNTLFFGYPLFAQKTLTTNLGHSNEIWATDLSGDGKYILSAGDDHSAKLWSVEKHCELRTFKGHLEAVNDVTFIPGDTFMATASRDGQAIIWNIKDGSIVKRFYGNLKRGLYSVKASQNAQLLAFVGFSAITIVDLDKLTVKKTLTGHSGTILSIDFSPDNKYLAAAGVDKKIYIYEIGSGTIVQTLNNHSDRIHKVQFSSTGNYILSASDDKTVRVFNTVNWQQLVINKDSKDKVKSAIFSSDESKIYFAGYNQEIREWNWKDEKASLILGTATRWIEDIAIDKSGETLVAVGWSGTMTLWQTQTKAKVGDFNSSSSAAIKTAVVSSNNTYLALGGYKNYTNPPAISKMTNSIMLIHLKSKKKPSILSGHIGIINAVVFAPNEDLLYSCDAYGQIKVWDVVAMKCINTIKGHSDGIISMDLNSEGTILATSGKLGIIRLWNTKTWEEIRILRGHLNRVGNLRFNKDGSYLASASDDKTARIWDVESGKVIQTFKGHNHDVFGIAFGKQNTVVSGSIDHTIRIWDIETGNEIKRFEVDDFLASDLDVSPDGKTIITARHIGITLKIDIESGRQDTLFGHLDWLSTSRFSPDGKYIITAGGDGFVNIYNSYDFSLIVSVVRIKGEELEMDYVITTPDGRFDGTENGIINLYYVDGLDILPLSSLYEINYNPRLLYQLFAHSQQQNGTEPTVNSWEQEKPKSSSYPTAETISIPIAELKLPPEVNLTFVEESNRGIVIDELKVNESESKSAKVIVTANSTGSGLTQVLLYLNGKLINKWSSIDKESFRIEQTVELVEGENTIIAKAYNSQNVVGTSPNALNIICKTPQAKSQLYAVIVGIDNYANPKYNLNYAVADASSFKNQLEKQTSTVFANRYFMLFKNDEASSRNVRDTLISISKRINPEDVFVFYYAGHGVMSLDNNPHFFIATHDVKRLYSDSSSLATCAISADELNLLSQEISANKQVFILDACQSGGAISNLNRGIAEERAIAQLARSTGTYWLTASGADQNAGEFESLGHGVFTYCLLKGLMGEADGLSKDQKITVKELSIYLDTKVPELSEKHKGNVQYPTLYGFGQDFPLVIIN